jgi:hypothetical protein
MPQMLQQLQLSVSPLAQHRCGERLHNFLDSDGCAAQLILCGTDETEGTYRELSGGGLAVVTAVMLNGSR